jgi:hypothetical protein
MQRGAIMRYVPLLIAVMWIAAAIEGPVHAQNSISFVSGTGSDSNPCTRTLPCASLQRAHDQTNSGGFVNCLDPGSFGRVTVTRSITIDCSNTFAAVMAPTTVNNPPAIDATADGLSVFLRGLSLGGGTGGQFVRLAGDSTFQVQRTKVTGPSLLNPCCTIGISFSTGNSGVGRLSVTDTIVSGTIGAISMGGCLSTLASLQRVRLVRNQNLGLDAEGTCNQPGTATLVTVVDSLASLNAGDGFRAFAPAAGVGRSTIEIQRSVSTLNGGAGVDAFGALARVIVGSTMLTGNTFGFETVDGGAMTSYRNNSVDDNTTNGTPTGTINPM